MCLGECVHFNNSQENFPEMRVGVGTELCKSIDRRKVTLPCEEICPIMTVLKGSQRDSGLEKSLIEVKEVMIPRVVPLRPKTDTNFGVCPQGSDGGVKIEPSCGVEAELVSAGIPNPFVSTGKEKGHRGRIRRRCRSNNPGVGEL
jgi:hypothetical protein